MSDSVRTVARELLSRAVQATCAKGLLSEVPDQIPVERPKCPEHGDYATNVALGLAKAAGKPPRVLGEAIAKNLRAIGESNLAEVTVAGPGFVNLSFSDAFWQQRLLDIRAAGRDWGRGQAKVSPSLCVEYLPANPTGPLHFAHGRHTAVGDSLTRLLRFTGYDVVREFYLNDAGNQVGMLAFSVWTRYMEAARAGGASVPEVTPAPEGARGQHPAARASAGGGLAHNLGLAADRRSTGLGRGHSSGSGNRTRASGGFRSAGIETRRNCR